MNAEYRPVAPRVDVPGTLRALGIQTVKRGDEYWASCPWPGHSERTPSWSIKCRPGRAKHGYHKCLGCGETGGVVELVEKLLDFATWQSALAWLEERGLVSGQSLPGGVRLVLVGGAGQSPECAVPHGVVFGPLSTWRASLARRYALLRGLTDQQVDRWGVGYGGSGELLGRLFLPVHDRAGRLRSYAARTFAGHDKKYLDPPRGAGADRAAVFGERHWPEDCSAETLVLCEGELNALACERAGARCVGAIGGSGLDPGQNLRVARFGRVLIATDVDKAGTRAAGDLRAALARWRSVARVQFPAGQDACDVEREDVLGLRKLLLASGMPAAPGGA